MSLGWIYLRVFKAKLDWFLSYGQAKEMLTADCVWSQHVKNVGLLCLPQQNQSQWQRESMQRVPISKPASGHETLLILVPTNGSSRKSVCLSHMCSSRTLDEFLGNGTRQHCLSLPTEFELLFSHITDIFFTVVTHWKVDPVSSNWVYRNA